MTPALEASADEVARLRRCLNDLISVVALPALWADGGPERIASTLLDAVSGMLRLAFVFVRLHDAGGGPSIEMIRAAETLNSAVGTRGLSGVLTTSLGEAPLKWPLSARIAIGHADFSIASVRLGVNGEVGVLVAGAERSDFPQQTERLVLDVAANQAAIGLQQARLLTEQKRVENEHTSRLIVDSIPGLITVVTPAGEFETVSQPVLEYVGKPMEGVSQWAINEILHADDRSRVMQTVEEALATGDPADFEARLRRFDGAYRWFHIRGLPLRDRQGRIVRWYFLHTDVDERKRADDALKNSERNLKVILDTIPALVWCNLPDGPNEFLSKRWSEYTGLTAEESHGWGWQSAMHPDDLPPLMKKWGELMISGEPGEIEARLRRHDGVYRWFLIRAEPFRGESGRILKWYGTSTDIEDRKQAEEELRRKEDFLATAQRLSLSGSFSWCLDTNEVIFSEGAYRIFEFDRDSPVTLEQIDNRIHPEDRDVLPEKRKEARTASDGQDYQIRLLMPDGSIKYLHTSSSETHDASGRRQYIGALQDVTQRRLAEGALNEARSELAHVSRITSLSALTASIAHEINQPLSGIITNAGTCLRMLNADPPNVDGARETARRTIRDGNRVSDVVTRLRALFSKKELTLEPMDLNDAAREVIALSMNDLQRNRVSVRSELAGDVPLVIGDRVQLQQVILNLLRNASDAMADVHDRPRSVRIKTEFEKDGEVRLSLRDAGVGVVGQDMNRIFDTFFTTKSGGMGIGLSVSRSIIEKHHGRLWAEQNDGPGATFAFTIPSVSVSGSDPISVGRNL